MGMRARISLMVKLFNAHYFRVPSKEKIGQHDLGIFDLPCEVIDMIFSEISDARTAFSLAATNTQLMIIGERRIHRLMGLPHWIGDRIICVGDLTSGSGLPEGVVLGDGYEDFLDAEYESDSDSDCSSHFVNRSLLHWAFTFRSPATKHWSKSKQRLYRDEIPYEELRWFYPPSALQRIADELSVPVKELEVDIVWNLTKQVYFRREAIPKDLPDVLQGNDDFHMMGTILILQTLWSSNTGWNACGRNIAWGKWAGDRFEVSKKDVLDSRLQEEGSDWKDVSEEVINVFLEVFSE